MQMGFWTTDMFLKLVSKLPGISINDFEIQGTLLTNKDLHRCYIQTQKTPFYEEAMRQGKKTAFYEELTK
jgi:hypothetical protein